MKTLVLLIIGIKLESKARPSLGLAEQQDLGPHCHTGLLQRCYCAVQENGDCGGGLAYSNGCEEEGDSLAIMSVRLREDLNV